MTDTTVIVRSRCLDIRRTCSMIAVVGKQVWNRLVAGDNLAVLPTLAPGSFDLAYLDPPYNTGNEFGYVDRFASHDAWVAMLRPRLAAVHTVLAETGAVAVSIDDHEVARLRLLLDEVFGEAAFLAQVVVELNPKGRQLGRGFATSHEYLLVYARDPRACVLDASTKDGVDPADFPLVGDDGRRFRRLPLRNTNKKFNPDTARTLHYPLWGDPESGAVRTAAFDGGVEIWPVFGDGTPAVWRWSPPRVDERPDDLVCRRTRGPGGERVDVFQRDWLHPDTPRGRRKKLRTVWRAAEVGLHRRRGGRAQGAGRAGVRDAEAHRPAAAAAGHDAGRRPGARLVRGVGHHRPRRRPGQPRRRRHPHLPQHRAGRAEPPRIGRAPRRSRHLAEVTEQRLRAVSRKVGGGFLKIPPSRS